MFSNIVEFIKEYPVSKYQNCRNGNLWYIAGDFEFPIPLEEVEGGIFHSEMDTQLLKRWIRKHMTFLEKSGNEVTSEKVEKINGDEMVSTVKKE